MYEVDESPDDRITSERFLRSRMVQVLPLVRYVPAPEDGSTAAPELRDWENSEFTDFPLEDHNSRCYICWEDYQPPRRKSTLIAFASEQETPELLKQFACGHAFHKRCAEHWARENDTCFLCRRNLRPPEGTQTEAEWSAMYNLLDDQNGVVERAVQLQLLHTFEWGRAYQARFSADSRYLAFGCGPNGVWILDIATTSVRTFEDGSVSSSCFGPNGQILATGHADGHINIWKSDVVEYTLDGHTAMTWAFEVTTDGRLLISLSDDDTIWIWNTTNGSAIHNIKCSARLGFVSLVPDGSFIAHGQEGGKIDLWSVKKGRIIKQFKLHSDKVSDAVFTPSGEKMLTGSADMTMKVWDMATILSGAAAQSEVDENTQEASQSAVPSICHDMPHNGLFVGHKFPIWPLDISQDGQWAVSGDDQGMVHIWDVKTTVVQCVLRGHNNTGLAAVKISPNNKLIVTSDDSGCVHIWKFTTADSSDKEAQQVQATLFEPPTSPVNDYIASVTATVLPVTSSSTQLRVSLDNDHLLGHDVSAMSEQTTHSVLDVKSPKNSRSTANSPPPKSIRSKIFAKLRQLLIQTFSRRHTSQHQNEH